MKRLLILALALCLLSGCGTAAPSEETPSSPVYTDWSHLTPYEAPKAVYTLSPGYRPGSGLAPRDGYGMLLPYIGSDLGVTDYITDHLPQYGLVSAKGQLVTDPIYDSVTQAGEFLILSVGSHQTIAAWDGRWSLECDGSCLGQVSELLILCGGDDTLTFLKPDGTVAAAFPMEDFVPWLGRDFHWDRLQEGLSLDGTDDRVTYLVLYTFSSNEEEPLRLYLDLENGTVADMPPAGYPAEIAYTDTPQEEPNLPEYSFFEQLTDPVGGQSYYFALRGAGTSAPAYDLLDENGTVVYSNLNTTTGLLWQPIIGAGLFSNMEDGCFCYRTLAQPNTLVFCYPLQSNND